MFKVTLASLIVGVTLGQGFGAPQTTSAGDFQTQAQPQENNQDLTFNNTDWFGALVNPACQDECKWQFCDSPGEVCYVETCINPCTNETSCKQEYMQNEDSELLTFDCSTGIVEITPNCTKPECAYTDCAESNDGEVCWVEECTDQCEMYNCTVWYKNGDEWFGEECEDDFLPDVTEQQIIAGTQNLLSTYQNTFDTMLSWVCQNETNKECQDGQKQYNDFVTGTIPKQEPVPNTEAISQEGAEVAKGAMSGLSMFVDNTLSNYTDVLFSEPAKEMVASIVNDTNTANGDPQGNQMALQTYEQVDSTEQVMEAVESQITLQNMLNIATPYIESSADEGTKTWWNAFTTGLFNNGQQRKGDRSDGGN